MPKGPCRGGRSQRATATSAGAATAAAASAGPTPTPARRNAAEKARCAAAKAAMPARKQAPVPLGISRTSPSQESANATTSQRPASQARPPLEIAAATKAPAATGFESQTPSALPRQRLASRAAQAAAQRATQGIGCVSVDA